MTYYPSFVNRSGQVPMDTPSAPGETVDGAIVGLRADVADGDRATGAAQADADQALGLAGSAYGVASGASLAASQSQAVAQQALAMAQAEGLVYPTTAAAQADAALPPLGYYYVPNAATGTLDLWRKVDAGSSTFVISLPSQATVQANTATVTALNETVSATVFVTEPPAPGDTWVDIWTTISNPSVRWATSIVGGALQITQTLASVLLRGLCRKDQPIVPGLWLYAEVVPASVDPQTSICLLIAPDNTGGGILDATHGHALTWRNTGGLTLYRGDGLTAVAGAIPGGTAVNNAFTAGQTVGLGLLVNPELPTTGSVVQVVNGKQVGGFQVANLPTGGYVGAALRQSTNPITATIKTFTFHPTTRKKRYLYVNATGAGSLGTESSPYTTIQQGLLAANEQPGESLQLTIKGGVYRLPAGIVIPTKKYREVTIVCPASEKAKIYGSTAIAAGSAAWTKTAGTTNVWQGVLPKLGVGAGLIDMTHTVDMGAVLDAGLGVSPTPRAGYIAPYHIYKLLSSVFDPAGLAAQKPVCDAQAGSYFNDTSTGTMYVHPIDNSDPNSIVWERGDAPNLLSFPWVAATDMNASRVNLAGLHFFGSYSALVLIQRAHVDIENCLGEAACAGGGFHTDTCRGAISSTTSQYTYGDCFHADPLDPASVAQIPTVRLVDCLGRGAFSGGDGISNHELTNYSLRDCIFEYNGKAGMAMAGETHASNVICRHNAQQAFSAAGMTLALVRNYYLNDCELTDSPIGLLIQSQQAGDESHVWMRRGRIANTSGHAGTSNRRVTIESTVNKGLSTFVGLDVLDGGNNSADFLGAPNPGSIAWSHDAGYAS